VWQITVRTSNVYAGYPRNILAQGEVNERKRRGAGVGRGEKDGETTVVSGCEVVHCTRADSGERVASRILAFPFSPSLVDLCYLSLHPAFGLSSMCRGFAASRPPVVAVGFRHTFLNPSPSCSFPTTGRWCIFLAAFPLLLKSSRNSVIRRKKRVLQRLQFPCRALCSRRNAGLSVLGFAKRETKGFYFIFQ
jgi:hypothetical protein